MLQTHCQAFYINHIWLIIDVPSFPILTSLKRDVSGGLWQPGQAGSVTLSWLWMLKLAGESWCTEQAPHGNQQATYRLSLVWYKSELYINLTGSRGAQIAGQILFLGVFVTVSPAEMSIWVSREGGPHQCGWQVGIIQLAEGWNRTKPWRQNECALFEQRKPSSPALAHGCSWFLSF